MNRKFFALAALLSVAFSLSSCLNSDDTTGEYTQDTAITAFSLGSLDKWSKTTAGKDTLLKANVTGSNYDFYIDQAQRLIYNVDSLPYGARDSAVLATVTAKNSSPVVWMDIDKTDSVASYYSSSDSVNFSKPRYLRVYNNAYTAYATYKVTVNVHQQQANVFNWNAVASLNAQLAALADLKAIVQQGEVFVFGKTADGMKIYKSDITDGANWTAVEPNFVFEADDFKNATVQSGHIYILSRGKMLVSNDAADWAEIVENNSLKQLIGASTLKLYAYNAEGGISVSKDGGNTWTSERLDADAAYLPTDNISLVSSDIYSASGAEHLMLLGTRDAAKGDSIAVTWHRTVENSEIAAEGMWNYQELDAHQPGKMPWMDEVVACTADSGYVALGSNGKWYRSKNHGLRWSVDTIVNMPGEFAAASTQRFAFCRDGHNFYWVIRNGYVWKGRYNSDGWRKE